MKKGNNKLAAFPISQFSVSTPSVSASLLFHPRQRQDTPSFKTFPSSNTPDFPLKLPPSYNTPSWIEIFFFIPCLCLCLEKKGKFCSLHRYFVLPTFCLLYDNRWLFCSWQCRGCPTPHPCQELLFVTSLAPRRQIPCEMLNLCHKTIVCLPAIQRQEKEAVR